MDEQTATAIIAAVRKQSGKFHPLSAPTPTVGGWRIEFEQPPVKPDAVAAWFAKCGAIVTMCGVMNCYAEKPTWIAEFRR